MHKRTVSGSKVIGGAALAVVAVLAAPAAAHATGTATTSPPTFEPKPAGAGFDVAPLAGAPGSTVTFTGTGCLFDGQPGTAGVLVSAQNDVPVPEVKAGPDGRWTTRATVPAGANHGRHQVLARCVDATGTRAFTYAEAVYFVAVPGESPAVKVSDTSVTRGSKITVSGRGCLVGGAPGRLDVLTVFRGADRLERTPATVGADGGWKAEIRVPGDARIGSSPVGAQCLGADGSVQVFYVPATVTVGGKKAGAPTAEPDGKVDGGPGEVLAPRAVRATPRFTG